MGKHHAEKPRVIIIKTGGTMASLRSRRGDFEDWILGGMGLGDGHAEVVDVAAGQPLPPAARASGIVITGSHDMVTDRLEWSERTASWLAEAALSGTPLLGICYGHQLLAHALGGTVEYNPRGQEMGTAEITLLEAASHDPLLVGLPPTIRVHVSHSQSVTRLPPGAVRLAENAWDANQAFRMGACAWGVQFHPEFDAEIMHAYAAEAKRMPEVTIIDTPFGGRILGRFASLTKGQSEESDGR
jgi:GMP synthase (glutamine-hydrolysing)